MTLQMMKLSPGRLVSEELGSWGEQRDSRVYSLPLFSPHIKTIAKDHPHRTAKPKPMLKDDVIIVSISIAL